MAARNRICVVLWICACALLLLCLVHQSAAQRTYLRTCDCEYVMDGKCAYTLLLPLNKGENTSSQTNSISFQVLGIRHWGGGATGLPVSALLSTG